MPSLVLMEPSPSRKRLSYDRALRDPLHEGGDDIRKIKTRLSTMRKAALERMDASLQTLTSAFGRQKGWELFPAANALEAAAIIGAVCGDVKTIGVNQSAVLAGELIPLLGAAGFRVLAPYADGLSGMDIRYTESWQLPQIPFAVRSRAFACKDDLPARRRRGTAQRGARNVVAVMGVNAVSADDGGVVLLQHRQNVGQMLEECRQVILVAGLDKVVPTMADALFQTECMAWFGTDALPLGLGKPSAPHAGLEDYPFVVPADQTSHKMSLILLDNGRRSMMQGGAAKLLQCIGCRACIKPCPGSRFFSTQASLSPRELIFFRLSNIDTSLEHCLQCKNCRTACPLDIDLPGMILALRNSRKKRGLMAITEFLLAHAEGMERMGTVFAPFSNRVFQNQPIKQFMEWVAGISRQRDLPAFSSKTFARMVRESSSDQRQ